MSKDESEITGGKGRAVQRRAACGSRKAKPKRRAFTEARRRRFLNHFAASCNARAAARDAGVSENCVHAWRRNDAQFNAAWKEALELGYSRLEAELLRAAEESVKIRPRKNAAVRIGTMSPETALRVLEAYRRSGGRDRGTIWPHPYDVEEVRVRLEAKMRALRLIDEHGRPIAQLPAPGSADEPSSATPSAPPGDRGEDE